MKFLLYVFPYLHIDYVSPNKKRRLSCWIWCTVRIFTHAVWFMYQSSLHEENFDSLVLHLDDILVFSLDIDDHISRLDCVFSKL